MDEAVRERRELANELQAAIAQAAFELHFQVQATVATADVCGYEALVRWRHPVRGLVSPAQFIPLAEEIGAIVPLSDWILRQACFEAALWPSRHKVSVNLSPLQLSDEGLIDKVEAALTYSGLAPERLTLELTESAVIKDRTLALTKLRALKGMGISLALDDFGVGYSSLDVLRALPFDILKLDASFMSEIEDNAEAVAILRAVVSLGSSLGLTVLAEGIERHSQLSVVAHEGCHAIQGYLIGRPSRVLVNTAEVRAIARPQPLVNLASKVA